MHRSPAVVLGCTDCHGGNPTVTGDPNLPHSAPAYVAARERAHVLPRYPIAWHYPSSANPRRTYTLLNIEAPEYVRFINPSDYRAARDACGACHIEVIEAAERSIMSTGAMLWGGASYNNGILPFKNYLLGEAYTRDGRAGPHPVAGRRGVERRAARARRSRRALSAADLACRAAGRHLPRLRARRPQHQHPVRRGRPAQPDRHRSSGSRSRAAPTSASRTAAPAPACASRSRAQHRTRPASTIPSCGSWAPTTSRATIAIRAARAATSSMPTTASRGTA